MWSVVTHPGRFSSLAMDSPAPPVKPVRIGGHSLFSFCKSSRQESSQAKLPTSPGVCATFFFSNLLHNKKDWTLLRCAGAVKLLRNSIRSFLFSFTSTTKYIERSFARLTKSFVSDILPGTNEVVSRPFRYVKHPTITLFQALHHPRVRQ